VNKLWETLERDARKFLRDEVDPVRDADNAKRFRSGSAKVTETVTVMSPKKVEASPPVVEEMRFSENSNGQGIK
jgi:hypothetical protein